MEFTIYGFTIYGFTIYRFTIYPLTSFINGQLYVAHGPQTGLVGGCTIVEDG